MRIIKGDSQDSDYKSLANLRSGLRGSLDPLEMFYTLFHYYQSQVKSK